MFTERDFSNQVLALGRIHKWHVYTIPDSRWASLAGFPDLALWKDTHFFFVELKTDKGRVSMHQERVHEDLRRAGQTVLIWRPRDWDEIEKILGSWPE